MSSDDNRSPLSFKFTRGGIKLNSQKLIFFTDKYRETLLKGPERGALDKVDKDAIIREYITEPVLAEIRSLIRGKSKKLELLPEAWRHDLTLIPAMSALGITAQAYIFELVTERGGYLSTEALLQQHPYLIWQVPEKLYRDSLASYSPDQRVINVLEEVLNKPPLWEPIEEGAHPVMEAIWAALDGQNVDRLVVYNTLRFIGAGSHDVVSLGSTRMFAILGRQEWRRRTDTVKNLLGSTAAAES
ncbi:hypothetical protein E4U21_006279 [Claviceps maximensis]|nr:hypothetical protein E4U21_006279 [Claviceps maximensis]